MNSSVQPFRQIASNLLWTPGGWVRDPLVGAAADGSVRSVAVCPNPDRLPATEFYAGVLVPEFPDDYRAVFGQLLAETGVPLAQQLARCTGQGGKALVVISGLDYEHMTLTSRSQIRKL